MLDHPSLDRAVQGMEAIVHLACATGVADEAQARRVNVDGTRALLAVARQHGVRRFVFVSTVSATRERLGPYGRTKKECEALVAQSGLEWTIVRPGRLTNDPGTGFVAAAPRLGRFGEVPRDDVALVLLECLDSPGTVGVTFELLAGETPAREALRTLRP